MRKTCPCFVSFNFENDVARKSGREVGVCRGEVV